MANCNQQDTKPAPAPAGQGVEVEIINKLAIVDEYGRITTPAVTHKEIRYPNRRCSQRETTQPVRTIQTRSRRPPGDDLAVIEQSYDQLDGEWLDWLDTARAYDRSIPEQDRLDLRHNILIELARARVRDNEAIPKLRQYRIASIIRIHYWRERGNGQKRVCIYDDQERELHCTGCEHKPTKRGRCAWYAVRPVMSLDRELTLESGEVTSLGDTIIDDHALDLEAWQDAVTWRIHSPARLVEIAYKVENDQTLTGAERKYLWKWRKREQQKKLF